MVYRYRRKTEQPKWTEEDARRAVQAISNGSTIKNAADRFGVPKTCIIRRLQKQKKKASSSIPTRGSFVPVFTEEEERELKNHLILMQDVITT